MSADVIKQSIRLWEREPETARISPVVKARTGGVQAIVETGPFSWHLDLPALLGGENKAPSPIAMLLSALAGCATIFLRDTLAPQLDVRVDSVQAEVKCKADFRGLLGMQGAVPDLESLEVSILIQSPESDDKIQALYQAWLERCPIYLALTKPLLVKTVVARIS